MTVNLKRSVNKQTALALMKAINRVTLADNLLRENGFWRFSIKPKKEIPTMSIWFQFMFDKQIKDIKQ